MRSAILAACMLLGMLVGCGGGGGSGAGTPSGAFTISATSASFSARQNDAAPASQSLTINITGPNATYAGAAYPQGQLPPAWLGFKMTGAGTTFSLELSITTTSILPGQYTTTFGVGTADAQGNILQHQNVTVTFTVTGAMSVASAPYSTTFTYGGSTTSVAVPVAVAATGLQWKASSDSPWLSVPTGGQTGAATLQAMVNVASLAPGSYVGHVTVVDNADSTDAASMQFSITVQAPTLTVTQASILLGGSDGLSTSTPQNINFAVSTDTANHPFSITLSTTSGGNWLGATATSGVVNSSGITIQVSGNRSVVQSGTYTGQVQITVPVGTLVLTNTLPVTFNVEANRIVVGAAGVGFLSSPTRSVLTRNVTVFSGLGRTDTPWQTNSDQAWLTATNSGVTGGSITLTAAPTGLTPDTTHFANVTVTSSDATVENQETIRVALYVSSTTPTSVSQAITEQFVAASPVEPIVFVSNAGTDITGYNVYTGAVDRTFAAVAVSAGPMVVSADGKRLFVYDQTVPAVIELDANTGASQHAYASSAASNHIALGYVRPNGHSLLITPSLQSYDVSSHVEYDSSVQAFGNTPWSPTVSLAGSPDNSKLVTDSGGVFSLSTSALGGGKLSVTSLFGTGTAQGAPGQACFGADGQIVYTASGSPYNFYGTSISTRQLAQTLAGQAYPDSVVCAWNGVVAGGTEFSNTVNDIFVYNGPTGAQLTLLNSSAITNGNRVLIPRGMAVSADATRLITLISSGGSATANEVRFQDLPAPP